MQEIVIGKDQFSTGELIGKGGEGEVYAIRERSGLAVKIYNASLRNKREDKIRAMVGEGLVFKTKLVAYPGDVVTDRHGNFLGFLMQLVSGYRPLHELYSPKSRQRFFPKADYRFVINAALNVARAVGNVHQTNCIIGDLNHSGVLLAQDSTVTLIDADSFQFSLNGISFPCVVGVPDFTPPELHGKNLASVQRTLEHDYFGLAVAIFHLLFMGRHPYAGCYNGPDISMGDAIAQNRFAFSLTRQTETQTIPPPGSMTLDMFPEVISHAFEKAFGLSPKARPTPLDWIHTLTSLEGTLSHCGKVKTHYYPSNAGGCVWCRLSAKSGFDMFPDQTVIEQSFPSDARGTDQAIQEILAFHFPSVTDLLSSSTSSCGASNALCEAKNGMERQAFWGLLMMGGAFLGFISAPMGLALWLLLAFGGCVIFSCRNVEPWPFQQAFKNAEECLQRELDIFIQRNALTEVVKIRSDLDAVITAYKGHDGALAQEIQLLKANRESRQKQAYLDRFSIRGASIPGIGQARTATLISFGIETAADVNRDSVRQIPGFGAVMTDKLLSWKREHELRFRYDPTPNAQDVADEQALRGRFSTERARLESAIRNGLGTLRNAKGRLDALIAKAACDKALSDAIAARAQAEQDLRELGVAIPPSIVSLTVQLPPKPSPQTPRSHLATTFPPKSTATTFGTPSCPRCGSTMRQRSGRYGRFWGCSRYPGCRGTRRI